MGYVDSLSDLERHAFSCLAFGVIGDAMGSRTEFLEPEEIRKRFGWVDTFEGDGTDDVIMRDLLADALVKTDGNATADDWAMEWKLGRATIFGEKADRFFPSTLHMAEKIARDYPPQLLAVGTMPSSTSAMSIAPVGIVNAGNPDAAARQASEIASLMHVTENAFCQHGAAAVAAAIAASLARGAGLADVLAAASGALKRWSAEEMNGLVAEALELADTSGSFDKFCESYHRRFRRAIVCDSRETIPATLAIVKLAGGDPWKAATLSANFGRDSDTIGCMAAGICGALDGMSEDSLHHVAKLSDAVCEAQRRRAVELSAVARRKAARETTAWANSL